jgi:hypothetical protein
MLATGSNSKAGGILPGSGVDDARRKGMISGLATIGSNFVPFCLPVAPPAYPVISSSTFQAAACPVTRAL